MVIEFDESYNITIQKWSVRSPLKTKLTSFSSNSRLAFFSFFFPSNWFKLGIGTYECRNGKPQEDRICIRVPHRGFDRRLMRNAGECRKGK